MFTNVIRPGSFTSGGQCSWGTRKLAEYSNNLNSGSKQYCKHVKMAPTTRSTIRDITPDQPIVACEATTKKRIRFFEAYDSRHATESLRAIAKSKGVAKSSASRWL